MQSECLLRDGVCSSNPGFQVIADDQGVANASAEYFVSIHRADSSDSGTPVLGSLSQFIGGLLKTAENISRQMEWFYNNKTAVEICHVSFPQQFNRSEVNYLK